MEKEIKYDLGLHEEYEFVKEDIVKKSKLLVEKLSSLKKDGINYIFKASLCYKIFFQLEKIFESSEDPQPLFEKELDNFISFIDSLDEINTYQDGFDVPFMKDNEDISVQDKRSGLYGDLWVDFPDKIYFDETLELLTTRFRRNNIDLNQFEGKVGLDAGCGGGRYTVALSNLGFSRVEGTDMGEKGINDAKNRIKGHKNEKNVNFRTGSVLDLPFDNNTFNFVFSNGVIHHSENLEKGLDEIFRVLKPGGFAWIYVHHTGGLQNMLFDAVTEVLKSVPRKISQSVMKLMGVPPNRIFYFLDPFYAPINRACSTNEFLSLIKNAGFINAKKLMRGTNFDTIERIHQKEPYAEVKFGEGDLRVLVYKPTK